MWPEFFETETHLKCIANFFQDIGERNNVSLRLVRQLIPLPKLQAEVITLEPWGSVTDTKGNRLQEFDKDKKHVSDFLSVNLFRLKKGKLR